MTFASRLQDFGNQPALVLESGARITYKDLASQADDVYGARGNPSIARTLVAVECDNTLASVAGYLGAMRNDFPILLVDAQLAPELREKLYAHFCVSHIWTATDGWRYRECDSPSVHRDVGLLLSTSGSTGSSKLAKLTRANLQANAASIAQYLELDEEERPVTSLPIHYSYGLSILNSHLAVGATLLLTSQPVISRKFWDFFCENEATSLAGVPTTYSMLKQMHFERMALPSLRTMTQAGGRLSSDLVRWFGELAVSRGQRFVVMYGQTEASPRMAYVPPERVLEKIGSIGVPIPGGRLELVADDGRVIEEPGVHGELRYSGPNVMMGYAANPEDLAMPDKQGGILLTGDLAWRDVDGYFHLVGRLKRFIKVFGNRIGLDEIEVQLRDKGYDVAVTGRDDLLVIALRDAACDKERLMAQVCATYRIHHSAIRVVATESFPLSSAGKVQYTALLDALVS